MEMVFTQNYYHPHMLKTWDFPTIHVSESKVA